MISESRMRVFGQRRQWPHGSCEITLGSYGAGEYIGEMCLDGKPCSASVAAVQACECAVVEESGGDEYTATVTHGHGLLRPLPMRWSREPVRDRTCR